MGYAGIKNISKYSNFVLQTGDILMSHINSIQHLGKTACYEKREQNEIVIHGMNLLCLRSIKSLLHYKYAYYYFHSNEFKSHILKITKKSVNQASFNVTSLKNLTIPLPPLETQKQIAKTLDTAAELLAMRKQQLAELDNLIKSIFYNMFGKYYHLDCFKTLPSICKFIDYRGKTPPKSDNGIPLITAKNVKNNTFSIDPQEFISAKTYDTVMTRGFPRVNDVIFTTEAPLGNVCRIPKVFSKFAVGQRIIVMQPFENFLTPEYLEFALTSDKFQNDMLKRASGSTVRGIRSKELVQLSIPVPPLKLQSKFSIIVTNIEEQKALVKKAIDETKYLIDSLMSKYFD